MSSQLTLREKRVAFSRAIALLLLWAQAQGWDLALGEGYVALTDARDGDWDGPHMRGGTHYAGTGQDVLLYINGAYITDGSHPAFLRLGEFWERIHPLARWGGRHNDANHFSFEHDGKR